jgi:hypothetical protein
VSDELELEIFAGQHVRLVTSTVSTAVQISGTTVTVHQDSSLVTQRVIMDSITPDAVHVDGSMRTDPVGLIGQQFPLCSLLYFPVL